MCVFVCTMVVCRSYVKVLWAIKCLLLEQRGLLLAWVYCNFLGGVF